MVCLLARFLVQIGKVDLNLELDSKSQLLISSHSQDNKIVKFLIAVRADLNKSDNHGYTPLMRAAYRGDESVVRLLIDSGAEVNRSNNDGCTPLMQAVLKRNESVVRLLIDKRVQI